VTIAVKTKRDPGIDLMSQPGVFVLARISKCSTNYPLQALLLEYTNVMLIMSIPAVFL
jgi:hypothetical protein